MYTHIYLSIYIYICVYTELEWYKLPSYIINYKVINFISVICKIHSFYEVWFL